MERLRPRRRVLRLAVPTLLAPVFVGLALRRKPAWRPLAALSLALPAALIAIFAAQSAVGDLGFTAFLVAVFGWVSLLARRLGRESPDRL